MDLKEMLERLAQDMGPDGDTRSNMRECVEAVLPRETAERLTQDAVRWTMTEVLKYAMGVIGADRVSPQKRLECAKMVGQLGDYLVANVYFAKDLTIPSIKHFHTMEPCQEHTDD